jgi:hypothetical protein
MTTRHKLALTALGVTLLAGAAGALLYFCGWCPLPPDICPFTGGCCR